MNYLYNKNRLNFSLVMIFTYIVLSMTADIFSHKLGIEKVITAPLLIIFSILLFSWIRNHDLLEEYGLCRIKGSWQDYLYFLPLLLIITTNLWNGFAIKTSAFETICYILSMLCVGFIEEIIFRGFLFKAIYAGNMKEAILISSLTFGFGHIINLLNGANFLSTLLQICYASAIGFLFTIIFLKEKSLLPCILTHSILNSLSIFAVQGTPTTNMILSFLLCAISILYAFFILKSKTKKTDNMYN